MGGLRHAPSGNTNGMLSIHGLTNERTDIHPIAILKARADLVLPSNDGIIPRAHGRGPEVGEGAGGHHADTDN